MSLRKRHKVASSPAGPSLTPPAVLPEWESPRAMLSPFVLPTYGVSSTKDPAFRERCLRGGALSLAARGDMVFGALIRRQSLPLRWFCKESILSRPRGV